MNLAKKIAFDPEKPFKLSRTAIDEYLKDRRTFILKRKFKLKDPKTFPLTLNLATDHLLKNTFDQLRKTQTKDFWLWKKYGLNCQAFDHPEIDKWRFNFSGVRYHHEETNFLVFGALDDVWIDNNTKELIVIDYKSTAQNEPKFTEDYYYYDGYLGAQYKRQQEVYQWLLRKNGFKVCDTAYLLYVNGLKGDRGFFTDSKIGMMEFDIYLIPLECNDSWIEPLLPEIRETLLSDELPEASDGNDLNTYFAERMRLEKGP